MKSFENLSILRSLPMLLKPNIHFTKDTVIKFGDPSLLRIEVEKTRKAHQIGNDCGLFQTPEVVDFDELNGKAVFRRIEGAVPICSVLSWGKEYISFGKRLGTLLAVVHRNLFLPSDMMISLPPDFALDGHDVFLHGDLSITNVCLKQDKHTIAIFDWQMTPVHGGNATYGCRYFDVLWFINNLIWIPTISHFFGDPVAPVARNFIESYVVEANLQHEASVIGKYAELFFKRKLPLRSSSTFKQRLVKHRCNILTKELVDSLKTEKAIV